MPSQTKKTTEVKKLSIKVSNAIKNVKTLDKRVADLYKVVLMNA